jgi:MinD-like ATPase involved in chromosome partitioning or flagellar assembly
MGEVIGILSLKGGVGKTSSVMSLGSAISSFNKKVLVIDGNFSAPNLGLYLNILQPKVTIQDVLKKKIKIKKAIQKLDFFDIILASMTEKNKEKNYLKLKEKIKPIIEDYDFILIDSSPSLNDETLAVMLASDKLLVVTTPDYPTLRITMKAVNMAKLRGTPIIGLIVNKSYNKKFEISPEEIERISGVPVMAIIPHDVNVLKAVSEFSPLTSYKPRSDGSIEYKKLAAILIGEKYKPFRLKNLLKFSQKKQDLNRDTYYESVFR